MTEDNTVLVVAVLAVIASLAAAGFSYYSLSQGPSIVGFASTSTGTANLTISAVAEINFTTNSINWGTGYVTPTMAQALLNSEGVYTNWTNTTAANVTQPLVLENIGNNNVSLTLNSSVASQFIGGTSPSYKLKVTGKAGEAACTVNATYNFTAYTEITASEQGACAIFGYLTVADEIEIDAQVVVPYNAPPTAKLATIRATATVLP